MDSALYKGRLTWLRPLPDGFVPEVFEVASRALIVHEDKVLLVYHHTTDAWLTPGGRLRPGEAMVEGLGRELEEETGLEVEVDKLLLTWDVLMPKEKSHKIEFVFSAHPLAAPDFVQRDHVDLDPTGHVAKVGWFTADEVKALPRVFPDFLRNWPDLLERAA
jgi:ADP-ribose pyrophosphatase YjhB (NUDIX family)